MGESLGKGSSFFDKHVRLAWKVKFRGEVTANYSHSQIKSK
jgi:hypothetical protein